MGEGSSYPAVRAWSVGKVRDVIQFVSISYSSSIEGWLPRPISYSRDTDRAASATDTRDGGGTLSPPASFASEESLRLIELTHRHVIPGCPGTDLCPEYLLPRELPVPVRPLRSALGPGAVPPVAAARANPPPRNPPPIAAACAPAASPPRAATLSIIRLNACCFPMSHATRRVAASSAAAELAAAAPRAASSRSRASPAARASASSPRCSAARSSRRRRSISASAPYSRFCCRAMVSSFVATVAVSASRRCSSLRM